MELLGLLLSSGILAALVTISVQLWRERVARELRQKEDIRTKRLAVVADLIAYRFVLTSGTLTDNHAVTSFNVALNRVPVEFLKFPSVIDKYRMLGNQFTATKFHDLILEMIRVTDEEVPAHFDFHLLQTVPSVSKDHISQTYE